MSVQWLTGKCKIEAQINGAAGIRSYVSIIDVRTGYKQTKYLQDGAYLTMVDMSQCSFYDGKVSSAATLDTDLTSYLTPAHINDIVLVIVIGINDYWPIFTTNCVEGGTSSVQLANYDALGDTTVPYLTYSYILTGL